MLSLTKDNVDDPDNTYDFKLMISDALTSMGILLFVGLVWTRVSNKIGVFCPTKQRDIFPLTVAGQRDNLKILLRARTDREFDSLSHPDGYTGALYPNQLSIKIIS